MVEEGEARHAGREMHKGRRRKKRRLRKSERESLDDFCMSYSTGPQQRPLGGRDGQEKKNAKKEETPKRLRVWESKVSPVEIYVKVTHSGRNQPCTTTVFPRK